VSQGRNLLVAGLGNPGRRYQSTRHNLGFDVVEKIAGREQKRFYPGTGDYEFCRFHAAGAEVILLKPLTFMNDSGRAVTHALETFGVSISELLVVVDDIALPLGKLRLRAKGTDGGHNGLASVIAALNTTTFMRLRCGIAPELSVVGADLADFVLAPFDAAEKKGVVRMIDRAADAVIGVVTQGLQRTMNVFNEEGDLPLTQNTGDPPE
jgi:PTH1 family peptidyl-tRNA hydrolase